MNMLIKETFNNNNTFHRCGTTCLSKSSRKYAPMSATEVMQYGHSQLGPNFPHVGFFTVLKTFLNTKSPSTNGLSFTLAS